MCHCLLTSSIVSPYTSGSYRPAHVVRPFGLNDCMHLASVILRGKPRILGERMGCVFLDLWPYFSGASGVAGIMTGESTLKSTLMQ